MSFNQIDIFDQQEQLLVSSIKNVKWAVEILEIVDVLPIDLPE